MALAQRLNELAASHSQGLLNDDEYRLLRRDVFERFSDTTIIPVETHIIPFENHVVPVAVNLSEADHRQQLKREKRFDTAKAKIVFAEDPIQPHRPKHGTVTAGVASLFRRATGRKTSRETVSADVDPPHHTSKSPKKVLIPHLLSRKSSDGTSVRSGSDSVSSYSRSHKTSLSSSTFTPPTSPSNCSHPHREASASKINVTAATIGDDLFEDGGLNTTKDIRQAISDLEKEGRQVIDAFNDLERSTITRVYKDRPDARPPLCEAPVSTNWPSTPISPLHKGRSVSHSNGRSASSSRLSLSRSSPSSPSTSTFSHRSRNTTAASRSPTSRAVSTPSPFLKPKGSISSLTLASTSGSDVQGRASSSSTYLSVGRPQAHPLQRKGSVSSLMSAFSSSPNNSASASLLTASKYDSLSRSSSLKRATGSTGNLPLNARLRRPSLSESASILEGDSEEDDKIHPEVSDVRKRRREVIGRYEARLEYLRARLKGAELHEKLLKR